MTIVEIYIKNFGKLKDFRLSPAENLNIIYGENEAGKSTILAFIRQMLYGGRDRRRYMPRDGSVCSGTLTFQYAGKQYFLERTFGASRKTDIINLKNARTGAVIPIPLKQEPGEWLFDLMEDTFLHTVYIGQLACTFDGPKMGGGVITKLSNLNWAGDEELSYTKTDERLKRAVNALSFRNKGKIPETERQLAQLEEEKRNLNISGEILQKKKHQLIRLKKDKLKMETQRRNCEEYIRLCNEKIELQEFEQLAQVQNRISMLEQEHGDIADEYEILSKAKELYRECEKADAVIANYESDFSEQDARYKSFLKEYESVNAAADIDFDRVNQLLDDLETPEDASHGTPPWVIAGLITSLILTALFVILSVHQFWMLVPAIAAAVAALCFAVAHYQKNGRRTEPDALTFDAAEQELRDILQSAGCENLDELFQKKTELDTFQLRLYDFKETRGIATENLESAKHRKMVLQNKLCHLLSPVAEVSTLEQALAVIEQADNSSEKNMEYSKEISVLKAKRDTMLRGRDFLSVKAHAQEIRAKLSKVKNLEAFQVERLSECKQEFEELTVEISQMTTDAARLEGEIESSNPGGKTLETIEDEIIACKDRLQKYQSFYAAAELARNTLKSANEEMGSAFAPGINAAAAKVLSEITAGTYDDVRISGDLEPVVMDKATGTLVEKDFLSSGTVDQLYLALRLAVASKLFEETEPLPLLLDETLAQYDDRRMQQAMDYLAELPQQILLFSCQKREIEAVKGLENVNVIKL